MRAIDPIIDRLNLVSQFMKHPGEKGRLAELAISQWLGSFLPKKYAISTGFVAAIDNGAMVLSPQRDIIIYDSLCCSPIWKSEIGGIFPIECVYATIEIKTTLKKGKKIDNPTELFKAFKDARILNDMGKFKSYLKRDTVYDGVVFSEEKSDIPPRNYIIGYTTTARSLRMFIKMAYEVIESDQVFDTHCHGILILDKSKDWFIQRTHGDSHVAKQGIKFQAFEGSGWDAFCKELLLHLESMDINDLLYFEKKIVNNLKYPVL